MDIMNRRPFYVQYIKPLQRVMSIHIQILSVGLIGLYKRGNIPMLTPPMEFIRWCNLHPQFLPYHRPLSLPCASSIWIRQARKALCLISSRWVIFICSFYPYDVVRLLPSFTVGILLRTSNDIT